MPETLRILVVGAGALGGYFGARLLAARRDVTFLVRPQRAQALAAQGLQLLSPKGDLHLTHVPTLLAADLAASPTPFDLILLTCKSQDLEAAITDLAPAVGAHTAILPLLNGMAHLKALDHRFGPQHVLGGGCVISATRTPDGSIRHLNALDRLFFGERSSAPDNPQTPRMAAIAATLAHCGFDADPRPDVLQDMWQKWTFIAASAGITCLLRATIGDIVAAGATPLALQLFEETVAIAAHAGYPPSAAFVDQSRGYLTKAGSLFTASMLRDLESGAPIEARQIIGDLLDQAQHHKFPTPILEITYANLRTYEERRLRESQTTTTKLSS